MDSLIVFEAGMRNQEGKYFEFMESPDRKKVEDYLEIMKKTKPDNFELVFLEKNYHLVSTTPHVVHT